MDTGRYLELYLSESRENLQALTSALLDLERGAGDVALERAFRAVHTLKGMAAAMGRPAAAAAAHAMEDALEPVRRGLRSADAGLVDALLASADELAELVVAPAVTATAVGAADDAEALLRAEPDVASFELGPLVTTEAGGPPAESARYLLVDPDRLDTISDAIADLSGVQAQIGALGAARGDEELMELMSRAGRSLQQLQDAVLAVRMVPLREILERFPRLVRDTARALGKEIDFRMRGGEIELDRAILEGLSEPLGHLLRNALDHGIERPEIRVRVGKPPVGRLLLAAERQRSHVMIRVRDDGRGVAPERVLAQARAVGLVDEDTTELKDPEVLRILCRSGFSTAGTVTAVSGRGVGLDVVAERTRALGGSLDMNSRPGHGTTFTIRVPLTLVVTQALRVRIGAEDYAIPLTHVTEVVRLDGGTPGPRHGGSLLVRGEAVPVIRLRDVLGVLVPGREGAAIVAGAGGRRRALAVDELVGREQIVLKPFALPAGGSRIVTGATLLSDGRPALVLDPVSLF
jgi:two-component system, chemotaxis family, sensor kinase CheA